VARLFLTALTIWALCFSGANCGSTKVQGPQTRAPKTAVSPAPATSPAMVAAATLTGEHPVGSVPIAAAMLKSGADVLEVAVTKVVNPSQTSVSVLVSFQVGEKAEARQISIGSFSLYPPDQPGKFLLNAKTALREGAVADAIAKGQAVRLVFEMKRTHESKAWTAVELTIAEPTWRAAEK
jgi:hypothetical protein